MKDSKDLKLDQFDNEGFRACKKCGIWNIEVDGNSCGDFHIKCLNCGYVVYGENLQHGEALDIWNEREEN